MLRSRKVASTALASVLLSATLVGVASAPASAKRLDADFVHVSTPTSLTVGATSAVHLTGTVVLDGGGPTDTVAVHISRTGCSAASATIQAEYLGFGIWSFGSTLSPSKLTNACAGALTVDVRAQGVITPDAPATTQTTIGVDIVKHVELKRAARLVGANAGPEPVTKGHSVTTTATLERVSWSKHRYAAYAGQSVALQYHRDGASYATVSHATSSSTGHLTRGHAATHSGSYRYAYAGSTTSGTATSAGDRVAIKTKGKATPTPKVVPRCVQEYSTARCNAIRLVGHRFSEYPASTTNEDTLTGLKDVYAHGVRSVESDFWVNRSGTAWVWHDSDFCRVASPASLVAAGISPCTTKISTTTDAQMRLVRTLGGAPASTLPEVMQYSISHHVHVLMEVKPVIRTVPGLFDFAKRVGDPNYFTFYEAPTKTFCATSLVQFYRAQGFTIGLKDEARCPISDADKKAQGFSYVAVDMHLITKVHVAALHSLGLQVGNKVTASVNSFAKLVRDRADFIIASHPTDLITWAKG